MKNLDNIEWERPVTEAQQNCDHEWLDVTQMRDSFHKEMCIKCNFTRYLGRIEYIVAEPRPFIVGTIE